MTSEKVELPVVSASIVSTYSRDTQYTMPARRRPDRSRLCPRRPHGHVTCARFPRPSSAATIRTSDSSSLRPCVGLNPAADATLNLPGRSLACDGRCLLTHEADSSVLLWTASSFERGLARISLMMSERWLLPGVLQEVHLRTAWR